ncbi:Dehydrogenase/reductase SDR family member on chromosome X homolog [Seminavis robusta]|uniref:Dehydrogenase/reductase SDR family member on chromosome X homolog n=1 Tax=Seminavis robusta TaxID=568900 RepID=A0A9N8HZQ8_9STRA|nr:Dehydrogenase/reductase SDR family member on chromosome X homolog [Seminavis robusta]|eukprot:Sro3965_g352250.1 Dehydrogenase/reductase SDR family member on chromosome X homolog (393) ;mRNA; f:2013-3191
MNLFLKLFLVSLSLTQPCEAWAPTSVESSSASSAGTKDGLSRRNFMATSVAGAVLAGTSLTVQPAPAAAATTGLDLVQPNTLNGKVVVITGASTGLGLESAKALAKGGATVVLTARSEKKGATATDVVKQYLQAEGVQNDKLYTVLLDLDDLANVKSFPARFEKALGEGTKIDVLMNNAGVMAIPDRQITKDGYERTFQSNHLGHFALTAKLTPYLKSDARIINVSSLAYQMAGKGLDLDNLNGEKEYSQWGSYGQSKLENILFTQELQRRADAEGISLTATSLHPGAVNTDLARNMMGGEKVWYEKKERGPTNAMENILQATINKTLLTPEQGAATQVYLAATNDAEEKGKFYSDLKPQKLPAFATDEQMAKALWEQSEQLSGVKFSLKGN